MEDETGSVAIKKCIRWQPKMYFFLVYNNSEHEKVKNNKNVVKKIIYSEYKDLLLNKKYLIYSMNRIHVRIMK